MSAVNNRPIIVTSLKLHYLLLLALIFLLNLFMYCTFDSAGSNGKSDATLTQTLHECVNSGTVVKQWDRSSPQYMDRVNAVRDMIIMNGYPVTFVDQPGVRNMLKVFDPKFPVLGNIAYCLYPPHYHFI